MPHTTAQAIAQAMSDAGVEIVTHVPGHGATQTFQAFCELKDVPLPISFHEEPAYAIAHGGALAGVRSACVIKSHGLTKALNAAMDSLSCGVTAGMVNFVFEDKTGAHSDNIIRVEPVVAGAEMPYRKSGAATIYDDVIDAYAESERLRLPYTLIIDAAEISLDAEVKSGFLPESRAYRRDPMQHLVAPVFAPYQRAVLTTKLEEKPWQAIPRPEMPILPVSLPESYQQAVAPYLPLFDVFKKLEYDFVCGDAGVSALSALPPYDIAHAALYMGGSIPTATGAYLAGMRRSWSFIGDFSFISAGHYGLIEAVMRRVPLKVLIFTNGRAQTTGGQPLDLTLLARVIKGYEQNLTLIDDPTNSNEVARVLTPANESDELAIIAANFTDPS